VTKNKPTPPEDVEFMRNYIASVRWKFAKSYAKTAPHEYTVRNWDDGEWTEEQDRDFVRAVEIIRKYGYPERYWSKIHWYFAIDGLKYWTMGYPLDITKIINRADVNQTYGSQDPIEEFSREAPF
jgi:hypothetical protein